MRYEGDNLLKSPIQYPSNESPVPRYSCGGANICLSRLDMSRIVNVISHVFSIFTFYQRFSTKRCVMRPELDIYIFLFSSCMCIQLIRYTSQPLHKVQHAGHVNAASIGPIVMLLRHKLKTINYVECVMNDYYFICFSRNDEIIMWCTLNRIVSKSKLLKLNQYYFSRTFILLYTRTQS